MAREVIPWEAGRDIAALAAKGDEPHCLFGGERVVVRDSKQRTLVHIEHVSIYDDGNIAYDEAIRFERGGSIFLPVTPEGKIGLRQVWRPQTKDPDYRKNFPVIDVTQCGQITWDCCGGYGDPDTTPVQAARIEAEEEGRFPVVDIEYLGKTVINRGNDGHFTHLFWGTLDHTKPTATARDLLEKSRGNMYYFTEQQCFEKFCRGAFYDQSVISAIWAFGKKYPGRLA